MATKNGARLVASMQEALDHLEGRKTKVRVTQVLAEVPDVKAIRKKLGYTQEVFAPFLGTSISGLRKWEQKTRRPSGAAITLLRVAELHPEAVRDALEAARGSAR